MDYSKQLLEELKAQRRASNRKANLVGGLFIVVILAAVIIGMGLPS
jgi:hypothetical protein